MSIDTNDPRLTSYALGEMSTDESAAFAAELARDPTALAEVQAIRGMAGVVQAELQTEDAPALEPGQRAAITSAKPRRPIYQMWLPWATIAASIVVVVALDALPPPRAAGSPAGDLHARGPDGYNALNNPTVQFPGSIAVRTSPAPGIANVDPRTEVRLTMAETILTSSVKDNNLTVEYKPQGTTTNGANWGDSGGGSGGPINVDLVAEETYGVTGSVREKPKPGNYNSNASNLMSGYSRRLQGHIAKSKQDRWTVVSHLAEVPPGRVPLSPALEFKWDRAGRPITLPPTTPGNREGYDRIRENPFVRVWDEDTSTFSIDVDTAAYANMRRFLMSGQLPPRDSIRLEELINYFTYDYAAPADNAEHPFEVHVEIASCPWNSKHRLARIALKGKEMKPENRPQSNLVFLVDVSGSMKPANKLPLLIQGLQMLTKQLDEGDRVAIVVYASASGLVLDSTTGDQKDTILGALGRLRAGGSTNGGAGIELAYKIATKNFVKGGANRVILCTDGDFNVGVSDRGGLTRLIEEKAKSGVYLSVLGFGQGNLRDGMMEDLSNRGNGNYAYIDSIDEARKVLVEQMSGTLVTIAKDVKIQIFFNPHKVKGYRLVGYENRMLQKQDFNDDKKDAGDIGAGHTVTALYELVPADTEMPVPEVDQNPFLAKPAGPAAAGKGSSALFRLRLRYKQPDGDASKLIEEDVEDAGLSFAAASPDFQWASAVAAFGMLLRDSQYKGGITLEAVAEIAKAAKGEDPHGYRAQFLELIKLAQRLMRRGC